MNQLPQELVPAVCIITVKCLDNAPAATLPRIDPHCFPAAGTLLRYHALTIMPPVKVVLDMRDDHVPLRHQYAAPRMQFQIPDKGNVVEACPCYTATVNLHRVKHSHRRDLPGTSGCPFHRPKNRLLYLILKLIGDTVLIMMACPPASLGIGETVVTQHHAVYRQSPVTCGIPQITDPLFQFFHGNLCCKRQERAYLKSE